MTFDEALAACQPTIAYWRGQAARMGLDRDDVEQILTIKLHKITTENPDLRLPVAVYFRTVARNCVLDMQRVSLRDARHAVGLETHAGALHSSSSARTLANAEFQIDLEHAGLSKDAIRFIRVVLETGGRGARPAFGDPVPGHKGFYRARNEIRRFLEGRREAAFAN